MNAVRTEPAVYEPVQVGARFAGMADWGVMVKGQPGEAWKLVCLGCTRLEASELARRLNVRPNPR